MTEAHKSLLNQLPDAYLQVNVKGDILFANKRALKLLQLNNTPDNLADISTLNHTSIKLHMQRCSRSTNPVPLPNGFFQLSTNKHAFKALGNRLQLGEDTHHANILIKLDTSEASSSHFVALNKEVRQKNAHLKILAHNTGELSRIKDDLQGYIDTVDRYVITSTTDKFGRITYASDAFCKISQYSKEELLGRSHNIVRHPDMPASLYDDMWQAISSGKIWQGEIKNRAKDGSAYWVNVHIEPIVDSKYNITGYTAIRQDITDKKIIEEISQRDHLTGLSNRIHTDDVIRGEIERTVRYSRHISVILFDIDHFKQVNDQYGHVVGDSVLKEVASLTRKRIRETDTAGRWGGEEFLIICPETSLSGAQQLAEGLREDIQNHVFKTVKHITCSFGVALYDINESQLSLIKRVDAQLYRAKDAGRNNIQPPLRDSNPSVITVLGSKKPKS